MHIVKEARLYYREGTSDKVYELELQETGPGEYLVNFRYGRRGTALKEGTKTIFPVPLAEAEVVYKKLLKEKKGKGYQETGLAAEALAIAPTLADAAGQPLQETMLEYLRLASQGQWKSKHWKLSRLVWRAGELKLTGAEPLLLDIPPQKDEFFQYALAWALGRCGSPASTERLLELRRSTEPKISRIATVALLRVGDPEAKERIWSEQLGRLPWSFREALQRQSQPALVASIEELLYELKTSRPDFLFTLYLLAGKHAPVLPALQHVLQTLPFRPPYFQQIRYLLKASELLDDAAIWGVISSRIEKNQPFFNSTNWGGWVDNQFIKNLKKEFAKEDAKAAYSDKTRHYLQKRSLRLLDCMGAAGDKAYTAMAREVLLRFSDADDRGSGRTERYEYNPQTRRSTLLVTHHPNFWQYPLLNQLLYGNSARFEFSARGMKISYRDGTEPAVAAHPGQREEAFPHLWDQAPQDLVTLLQENSCHPVNRFAVKAFTANPQRKAYTTPALVKSLLYTPYPESHGLGLQLAREIYTPAALDIDLLFALLECPIPEAQGLGLEWLQAAQGTLLVEKDMLVRLLLVRQPQVNGWVKLNISQHHIAPRLATAAVEAVLEHLLQSQATETTLEATNAWVAQVADQLLILFPEVVRELPLPLLTQLVAHPLEEVASLGVKLLLRHHSQAEDLPDSLFEALLSSSFAQVRAQGVSLFGKLSDPALYERREVVVSFCISRHPEVRRQVQPLVLRLVRNRVSFGKELVQLLLPLFWQQETYEGLHLDLLRLFQESLKDFYRDIDETQIWKLIEAPDRPAHMLGSQLLDQVDLEAVPLSRMAMLADHELLSLRQLSHQYFTAHVAKARFEREAALKLLDTRWDDSFQFAKAFFETHYRSEDWTPALLVAICDHTREEVQQFGLRLITRHFRGEDGLEYMLKLSQHPNTALQQFVANYLNQYATGHPERIAELDYYFTAVLTQVNKGRVAKERVFDFLQREALASEAVAAHILPLITRISLTMAVRDKAHCLQLLARLKTIYPDLHSPLSIKALKTV